MALQKAAATASRPSSMQLAAALQPSSSIGAGTDREKLCWSARDQDWSPVPYLLLAPPSIASHADPCSLTHTPKARTYGRAAGRRGAASSCSHSWPGPGQALQQRDAVAPWCTSTAIPAPLGAFIAAGETGIVNAISHLPDRRPSAHLLPPFMSAKHDLRRGKAIECLFLQHTTILPFLTSLSVKAPCSCFHQPETVILQWEQPRMNNTKQDNS